MKIKNISNKIVSIGSKIVMPDDVVTLTEEVGNLPSVQILIKKGIFSDMSKPTAEDVEFEARVQEAAMKLFEEQKNQEAEEKPKRGRKKAAKEEVAEEATEE